MNSAWKRDNENVRTTSYGNWCIALLFRNKKKAMLNRAMQKMIQKTMHRTIKPLLWLNVVIQSQTKSDANLRKNNNHEQKFDTLVSFLCIYVTSQYVNSWYMWTCGHTAHLPTSYQPTNTENTWKRYQTVSSLPIYLSIRLTNYMVN